MKSYKLILIAGVSLMLMGSEGGFLSCNGDPKDPEPKEEACPLELANKCYSWLDEGFIDEANTTTCLSKMNETYPNDPCRALLWCEASRKCGDCVENTWYAAKRLNFLPEGTRSCP